MSALLALALASCGGGGGGSDSSAPSAPSAGSTRPIGQTDLQIAQSLYTDTARTPAGFYSEPTAQGHEFVATTHLKNADVDSSVVAPEPLHELCTNDWNEALTWSERSAQATPEYADLVDTSDEARYFEFGRVRYGAPTLYLRTRVFKCSYLDRSSANLRSSEGAAGRFNLRPLTPAALQTLAEYLWQFTAFNNAGHAVLKSTGGTSSSGALNHTLYIGTLVRQGISASCDRIDVQSWEHALNAGDGNLQLQLQTLWSFGARQSGVVAELCSKT